jgi:uncharacterized protein YpmB
MKKLEKLILPSLVILFVFIVYIFYFDSKSDLGKFSTFDPNNSASKEIRVKLLKEKGIDRAGAEAIYYVLDGENKEMMIFGPSPDKLPEGFDNAEVITLLGHLSGNGFHAHSVKID